MTAMNIGFVFACKKLFLILALAIGLGAASPQKASAQEISAESFVFISNE